MPARVCAARATRSSAPSDAASVQATGTNRRPPSGNSNRSWCPPCRCIRLKTASRWPWKGCASRVMVAKSGRSSRWVVCRVFRGLGDGDTPAHTAGNRGAGDGRCATPARSGRPSLRPGLPVHVAGLRCPLPEMGGGAVAFGFARRTAVAGPYTKSTGALWKCPAWGRPVNIALNLKVGEAGAPSPLEISRAIVADHACVRAARFPHSHSGHRRR